MSTLPIYRTGQNIPSIGFGTWQIPPEKVATLVKEAVEVGYKHIDCAWIYRNEYQLGQQYFSTLKNREDLFITSKLWSNFHEKNKVVEGLNQTLSNLCLDYLDLYLIHNPLRYDSAIVADFNESDYCKKEWILETWRAMEKLYESGRVKAIGVSNFTTVKLQWLLDEASIVPHVNQVELHPYLPQEKLVNFCRQNKIQLIAYSPLGSPQTQGLDLGNQTAPVLLKDIIVGNIAKRNNITPAQVLLAWSLQRGIPALVKSSSKHRMIENLAATNITLRDEDMMALSNEAIRCRYIDFGVLLPKDKTVEDFWDGELLD